MVIVRMAYCQSGHRKPRETVVVQGKKREYQVIVECLKPAVG